MDSGPRCSSANTVTGNEFAPGVEAVLNEPAQGFLAGADSRVQLHGLGDAALVVELFREQVQGGGIGFARLID